MQSIAHVGLLVLLASTALHEPLTGQNHIPFRRTSVKVIPFVDQPQGRYPGPRKTGRGTTKPIRPLPSVDRGVTQPSTPEARIGEIGPLNASNYRVFASSVVKPSGSKIDGYPVEPDIAFADANHAVYVANSYGAVTSNGGASWTHVDPYTKFGNPAAGFCCDQKVYSKSGITLWLLQYKPSGKRNVQRVAVFLTPSRLGQARPDYLFDISGATFGKSDQWLDFPDLAASRAHFHGSTNLCTSGCVGAVQWRISIADLRARNPRILYGHSGGLGGISYRHARQAIAKDQIYFATHIDTSKVRLFETTSRGFRWWDIVVSAWTNSNRTIIAPDRRRFDGNSDGRIAGGYDTADEVGFVWDSGRTPGRLYPHVRGVRIDKATKRVRQNLSISRNDRAVIYPSVHPNIAGHVGLTVTMGGPLQHPSIVTGILDDVSGWRPTLHVNKTGASGPGKNRWGDYVAVVPDPAKGNMTFIATGYVYDKSSASAGDAVPRMIRFGREAFAGGHVGLIVRSAGVDGVSISCTRDRCGQSNGATPFLRSFARNTTYTVTAPQVVTKSGRKYEFALWRSKVSPSETSRWTHHGAGRRTISLAIGSSHDIVEARYTECKPPAITQQPADTTECLGYSSRNLGRPMFVRTTDASSFQWRRNGVNMSGQTSPSLSLPNIQVTDAGLYDCVVSNRCGTVTSRRARLTVRTSCRTFRGTPSLNQGWYGADVKQLGDVDGDGYEDFGTLHSGSPNGTPRYYVYSGRTHAPITSAGGATGTGGLLRFGNNFAGGDVNGDGYSDVVYGNPGYFSGRGYLGWYSGKERKFREIHFGAVGTRLGTDVALLNLDKDSNLDLIAVATDRIYAYSSRANPNTYWTRLWNVQPIAGVAPRSLSSVGDVTGDGIDDFVLGLPSDRSNTGRWQLRSGADGALLGQAPGATAGWFHGHSVAGVGDADGDGVRDFVVGATGQGATAGLVQLFSGRHYGLVRLGELVGRTANARLGFRVAGTTIDENGDGIPEILASEVPTGTLTPGRVHVLHGRTLAILRTSSGVPGEQFYGYGIAGLDSNGDSKLDLLVGRPSTSGGEVWLYDAGPKSSPPAFQTFGSTCPDSQGRFTRIGLRGPLPRVGRTYRWAVRAKPNVPILFELGITRRDFDLTAVGMPGCRWYVAPFWILNSVTNSGGQAEFAFPVPNDSGFAGTRWFGQWFPIDVGMRTPLPIVGSNGGVIRIGAK